ncbi:unnamed protein product [Phytophthora fragariaefolia]|uniref:Unnamed protein product n=1 Tax=Phytophthora fragariaefolia TaxID=1490495 RepID=A0A9W7D192_9STRA|nr:unnamed protein product [Phytophthora fragariaefolia]
MANQLAADTTVDVARSVQFEDDDARGRGYDDEDEDDEEKEKVDVEYVTLTAEPLGEVEELSLQVSRMGNPRPVERNLVAELDASADDDDNEDDQGGVQGGRPPLIPRATRNADTPSANKVLARLGEEMRTRSEWMMMFAPEAMAQAKWPVMGPELTQPINSTDISQLVEDTVLLLKAMGYRSELGNCRDDSADLRGDRDETVKDQIRRLSYDEAERDSSQYRVLRTHFSLDKVAEFEDKRYRSDASLQGLRRFIYEMKGTRMPQNSWCEPFSLSLGRAAKSWYRQPPKETQQRWSLLSEAFLDYYCSQVDQSARTRYYSARRKENEPICDFLIWLNGYARTAKIQYEKGGADTADHVEQFQLNCGDDGIMDLLYPLQLADIQRVEQIINNKILGKKRKKQRDRLVASRVGEARRNDGSQRRDRRITVADATVDDLYRGVSRANLVGAATRATRPAALALTDSAATVVRTQTTAGIMWMLEQSVIGPLGTATRLPVIAIAEPTAQLTEMIEANANAPATELAETAEMTTVRGVPMIAENDAVTRLSDPAMALV